MAKSVSVKALKGYLKPSAALSGAPAVKATGGTTAELSGAPVSEAQRCARCVGRATRRK